MDTKKREHLHKLLSKLFEHILSEEETIILERMLEDEEEARLLYMQYVDLQVEFNCLVEQEQLQNKVVNFPGAAGGRKRRKFAWRHYAEAAVIAIGLGLGILFYLMKKGDDGLSQIADLHDVQGEVVRESADGTTTSVTEGMVFAYGDTIRTTDDPQSRVRVAFEDGTELRLWSGAELAHEGEKGKAFTLARGSTSATVSPQPKKHPLLINTSVATLTVVGTKFTVIANEKDTQLNVFQGEVRIKNAGAAADRSVMAGKYITVTSDKMELKDMPKPDDKWEEDFEQPFEKERKGAGIHVDKGLPKGSLGGVRMQQEKRRDGKHHNTIDVASDWHNGLFTIYDDSCLNFTYRFEKPEWYQIIMNTRVFEPDRPPLGIYMFGDARLYNKHETGKWLTASVPFTKFKAAEHKGDVDPVGDVPFGLGFSSIDNYNGLTIDKVWVTRGKLADCSVKRL
jgi:ferric-dicitrate binding protein FerR (iron transport regulator)